MHFSYYDMAQLCAVPVGMLLGRLAQAINWANEISAAPLTWDVMTCADTFLAWDILIQLIHTTILASGFVYSSTIT